MLVYFDESYKTNKCLFLGALFLPVKTSAKRMHKQFTQIKKDYGFLDNKGEVKEIKYWIINNKKKLDIAKSAIDLFLKHSTAYFRAGAIPYTKEQIESIGIQKGIPRKIKEATLYTKCTFNLFNNSASNITNGVLYMDNVTRSKDDRFDEILRLQYSQGERPTFKHIGYVDSSKPSNHLIQVCDLLLGAITNENYPSKSNKYKNKFREYVKMQLALPSLKSTYWRRFKSGKIAAEKHPKYTVRYWKFPYKVDKPQ